MSKQVSFYAGIEQESRSPVRHRSVAAVELITTVALAFSTVVAVTAVSIGMARADGVGSAAAAEGMALTFASFIGLTLLAMALMCGGLGALGGDAPRRD